jgi:anti-repressor protein
MKSVLKVIEKDEQKYADSRTLAIVLGIEHRSLMRTILDKQTEIEKRNGPVRFEIAPIKNRIQGGDQLKYALLTKDQTIAVGLLSRNSSQAVEFKMMVVEAFSEARDMIQKFSLPQNYAEALRALADTVEAKEKVEKELTSKNLIIIRDQPKLDDYEILMGTPDTFFLSQVAKVLGVSITKFFIWLRKNEITFTQKGKLEWVKQKYLDNGWLVQKLSIEKKSLAKGKSEVHAIGCAKVTMTGFTGLIALARATGLIHQNAKLEYPQEESLISHKTTLQINKKDFYMNAEDIDVSDVLNKKKNG